jgi:hypothetical protein
MRKANSMNVNDKTREQTQDQLEVARQFCVEHLQECCAELVEHTRTGILDSGRVRDLAKLCTFPASCSTYLSRKSLSTTRQCVRGDATFAKGEARPRHVVEARGSAGRTGGVMRATFG